MLGVHWEYVGSDEYDGCAFSDLSRAALGLKRQLKRLSRRKYLLKQRRSVFLFKEERYDGYFYATHCLGYRRCDCWLFRRTDFGPPRTCWYSRSNHDWSVRNFPDCRLLPFQYRRRTKAGWGPHNQHDHRRSYPGHHLEQPGVSE